MLRLGGLALIVATLWFFVPLAPAEEVTVELEAAGDITTWPDTPYRWMDIADNLYAESYRDDFLYTVPPETLIFVGGASDIPSGSMIYQPASELFRFNFSASDLDPSTDYSLIYLPRPLPGHGLIIFGSGTSNSDGTYTIEDSVQTGDLPDSSDANFPTGAEIWLVLSSDVDDSMSSWNQAEYLCGDRLISYTEAYQPQVMLTYSRFDTTFLGAISGIGLKPNFALQMKLVGKPVAQWGEDGDDWANEQLGFAGRWWEVQPSPGNRDDNYYLLHKDDPDYIFLGYLLFDYFATDAHGDISREYALDNSFHVLFKTSQHLPATHDSDPIYYDVDTFLPPPYDTSYDTATVGIFGQWEPGRAYPGEAELPNGNYNVQFVLTEESFHSSGLGGYWAAALVFDNINFTINKNLENGVEVWGEINTETDMVFADHGNIASLDINATDGYDAGIDVPEPLPPVSDFLSLYFPHSAWGSPFGDHFMVDVRNGNDDLTNDVKSYHFEMITDQTGDSATLSFTIGSLFPAEYGVVLYDMEDSTYQNLRDDNLYYFTSGESTRSFDLRLGDATAPQASITYPADNSILLSNQSNNLIWSTFDASPIRSTQIYYSLNDGTEWNHIGEAPGNLQNYQWIPPDIYTTNVRLKIVVEDWTGLATTDSTSNTFNIGPGYLDYNFDPGWHMISVPLVTPDTSLVSIFGDDIIGTYFVYDYSPAAGYSLTPGISNGCGYWLALEDSAMVDVDGLPAIETASLPLTLDWNMVGALFPRSMAVNDLSFQHDLITYSFSEAASSGWISPVLYRYDNNDGSYQSSDSLNPWLGYWIQALMDDVQLITDPPEPGSLDAGNDSCEVDSVDGWILPITLSMGNMVDYSSAIGMLADATDAYDIWFDLPAPPIPPDNRFLRLVFLKPEWQSPAGDIFSRDIRCNFVSPRSVVWEGRIESSANGEIMVDFGNIGQLLPEGYWAVLEAANQTIDLLETNSFILHYSEPCDLSITISNVISVRNITISIEACNVVLRWDAIPGIQIYNVYRSTNPFFDTVGMTLIASPDSGCYIDEGAVYESSYYYRITCETP